MSEIIRKAWLYILRFVFSIGYGFGIEQCFIELLDIHDALDDELIAELREAKRDFEATVLFKDWNTPEEDEAWKDL
jgi:hypothetical protein